MTAKVLHHKTERFGKVLWELLLDTIEAKINFLKNSKSPPHPNFIEELSQLILTLDTFLDTSSQDFKNEDFLIKVYDAVHLEMGEILRNSREFYSKKWFSNVVVALAED